LVSLLQWTSPHLDRRCCKMYSLQLTHSLKKSDFKYMLFCNHQLTFWFVSKQNKLGYARRALYFWLIRSVTAPTWKNT
jgi:hypothetical protein